MTRWLSFLLVLLTASAFAYAPVPKAMLSRTEMELRPGTRTLVATAQHSSKLFTTNSTVTFTNNALDQTTVNHFAEGQLSHRVWVNSLGQTNRVQTFTWDGRSRLLATTEVDDQNNGYNWSAVYDSFGRRLKTTTVIVTNGFALTNQPKVIASYFDPNVEFLELGVNVSGKARWKVCGPDLNGSYGGMNGTGGFDGIVDDVGVVRPLVSDARGNVHGIFDTVELMMNWNGSRPTGYGAVPEYRPLALSDNGDLGTASAWRGRWPDRSGLYWLGARYYDPVAGRFISCDPYGHDADPSLYAFADGDPINRFDPDGRLGKGWMEGWQVNSSSPADSSLAYDIGMTLGGIQGEYFRGLGGGGSITANTLTFGGSDYIGLTDSWQYQGGAYTGSRILATIGRESAITAATFGTAQLARGGSQGALYTYQGLQTFNAGRAGYNVGEGSMRVANGDAWGLVQVGAGGLGFAGSLTYAASNPGLNALGGVGPSSGGFAQGFVNWWNLGSENDAAFRSLSIRDQFLSDAGQMARPDAEFQAISQLDPVARGTALTGGGWMAPFNAVGNFNAGQVLNLMGTGPAAAVRIYAPGAAIITSGGVNVVSTVTMPLPQNGGGQ